MEVGLLGDTHGNAAFIAHALDVFDARGLTTIFQVGDLGIWPGERAGRMWNRIDQRLAQRGQTMYVAPGNHEDYDRIARLKSREDGWLRFRDHIYLAPRGHRTTLAGRSLVWLGGAASVDRTWRRRSDLRGHSAGKTWWEAEALADTDVAATIAGGHADIMVAHNAPNGVPTIDNAIAGNPHGFPSWDIDYAEQDRDLFTHAFEGVRPKLLLHGHYHLAVNEHVHFDRFITHVFGLSCDDRPNAIGVLDLDSLSPEFLR